MQRKARCVGWQDSVHESLALSKVLANCGIAKFGSLDHSPEDGAAGLDLLEVVDGRASHVTVNVQEGREGLQLLADDEALSSG